MGNVSKKAHPRKKKRGQTVVEYILLVAVIVGFSMGVYSLLKTRIMKPLGEVKKKFEGGGRQPSGGTGGKAGTDYYKDMEYKTK